jgi:hypothetical protein
MGLCPPLLWACTRPYGLVPALDLRKQERIELSIWEIFSQNYNSRNRSVHIMLKNS